MPGWTGTAATPNADMVDVGKIKMRDTRCSRAPYTPFCPPGKRISHNPEGAVRTESGRWPTSEGRPQPKSGVSEMQTATKTGPVVAVTHGVCLRQGSTSRIPMGSGGHPKRAVDCGEQDGGKALQPNVVQHKYLSRFPLFVYFLNRKSSRQQEC